MAGTSENLQHTPLHALHLELGAKMVPFAGYSMPVQYANGVMHEHKHTRQEAGLFDVSHMGQLKLIGDQAAALLETLVPVDIIDLPVGQQRYALLTDDNGGILDDLMVTNHGDCIYVVVNAACKENDIRHMREAFAGQVEMEILADQALLALQGPKAVEVLSRLEPAVADMVFMDAKAFVINGVPCLISRSGYTGEDGFEISLPGSAAEAFTRRLLDEPEVEPIGLAARDSLRLESGLCLYGNDITADTTPIEASLIWAISKIRRADGERAGGFPGAERIFEQIKTKAIAQKRVGLRGQGRAPVREGAELVNGADETIGRVTSGSYGPSAEMPVAMGYVDAEYAALDTDVFAIVRGKKLPMTVSKMPFVPQRYYRG